MQAKATAFNKAFNVEQSVCVYNVNGTEVF